MIKEGIAQGIYQTDYPEEVAEMLFLYANTIFDDLTEHSEEEKQKKTAAFVFNLERLLKMEQGSIKTIVDSIFKYRKWYLIFVLERNDYMKIIEVKERTPLLVEQLLEVWENP